MRKITQAQYDVAVQKVVKKAKKHFKRDGWDLDLGILNEEVYSHFFPEGYSLAVMRALGPKYRLTVENGRMLIGKKKTRKAK